MTMGPHASQSLDILKREAAGSPVLRPDEESALLRAAHDGDRGAVDKLVKAHVRFVFSVAEEFRHYGISFDELVSEGLVGLMEAIRRFDPSRGARLASYAAWWIRALLRRYTLDNRRIVRAPSSRNSRKLIAHLATKRNTLAQRLGHEPGNDLVASELGVTVADIQEVDVLMRKPDVAANGYETDDYIAKCAAPSPETLLIELESEQRTRAAVARGLDLLTARERRVIMQRGLSDEPRKLGDLGEELGVSRERVRQIERKSFAKMREQLCAAVA
jgi:RNA polymerase sigma-32 factor